MYKKIILLVICLLSTSSVYSSSIAEAEMLLKHGLNKDSKRALINIIFNDKNVNNIAEAYYLLGKIDFEEKQLSTALETWTHLMNKFPNSQHAQLVKSQVSNLTEITNDSKEIIENNLIALNYLGNAEFYLSPSQKQKTYIINTSNIDTIKAAEKWYVKIISEFPSTKSSRIAYEGIIRMYINTIRDYNNILLSEKERYPKLVNNPEFKKMQQDLVNKEIIPLIPSILKYFNLYKQNFPKSKSLQAFRYQISQIYEMICDYNNQKLWLKSIAQNANKQDTFYRDLAIRKYKNNQ